MELVDITDLKSVAVRHAGSIPASDTLDSNHNIYHKMKDCVKCGLSKNEDEFSKNDFNNLASWCKSCKRERARMILLIHLRLNTLIISTYSS